MPTSFTQSPPLAVIDGGFGNPYTSSPHFSSTSESSSSIMIVTIIIASAVIISASIYLLLRLLSKRFSRTFSTADDVVLRHDVLQNSNHQPCHLASKDLLDSLPLFTFGSVTRNVNGGDCAVCLSRFEPNDQLRLLPFCCHAFHAACIDKWIVSNQTCPLCRSTVLPSGSDALDKILSAENHGNSNNSIIDGNGNGNGNGNGGSFRIELGSISLRPSGAAAEGLEGARRSYSLGSFEYIVDDCAYEVSVGCTTHRRGFSDMITSNDKDSSVRIPEPEPQVEVSAAEVSGGRNWLREYVDRLASISSRTMSFRSSSRFFSGSSRRSEATVVPEDLEANRVGEEISELFRWLSGI